MPDTPFPIPENSPFFGVIGCEDLGYCPVFILHEKRYRIMLSPWNDVTASSQCLVSAVAAMEWHLRTTLPTRDENAWKEASHATDAALDAYSAARERMKGDSRE